MSDISKGDWAGTWNRTLRIRKEELDPHLEVLAYGQRWNQSGEWGCLENMFIYKRKYQGREWCGDINISHQMDEQELLKEAEKRLSEM